MRNIECETGNESRDSGPSRARRTPPAAVWTDAWLRIRVPRRRCSFWHPLASKPPRGHLAVSYVSSRFTRDADLATPRASCPRVGKYIPPCKGLCGRRSQHSRTGNSQRCSPLQQGCYTGKFASRATDPTLAHLGDVAGTPDGRRSSIRRQSPSVTPDASSADIPIQRKPLVRRDGAPETDVSSTTGSVISPRATSVVHSRSHHCRLCRLPRSRRPILRNA